MLQLTAGEDQGERGRQATYPIKHLFMQELLGDAENDLNRIQIWFPH